MRLSELKKMVKEEYNRYLAEQAMPSLPANPGAGGTSPVAGAGSAPKVTVEPGDIDVAGGEDAEATLRDIYEMLKDYFEGDAGAAAAADGDAAGDVANYDSDDEVGDDKDDDDSDGGEALQERFKRLANIIKG